MSKIKLIVEIPNDLYSNLSRIQRGSDASQVVLHAVMDGTPLDDLRAKIMQLDYDIEDVDYDYNDMAQTEVLHTIYREEVLQIIDKYKAESEDKE